MTGKHPPNKGQTHMETRKYEIADLFCGAGGSSEGARKAIEDLGGTMNLRAVNHWNIAIATHSANHPAATHVIEDVNHVDPEAVVTNGRLDILMASPECKFYSRARGGKPVHDQGRMNPWVVHDWLTKLNVQTVLIENVPEFTDWGPLDDDWRPIKSQKGLQFQAWFMTFLSLGYKAEWRMLNAADYGDATTRIRFFLIARKDGLPITWPEPSHAKGETGMFPGRLPWRGAREVIDWSNQGKSLLDHPKYLKKPLSEKTRARIARGLQKFGGPLAPLYIRLLDIPGYDETLPTEIDLQPFIINRHGDNGSARVHSIENPMPTATGRGSGYLVQTDAEPFHGSDRQHTAARAMEEPLHTITTLTAGGEYVVKPEAKPFVGANRNQNVPKDMEEPIPPVTTKGSIYLVEPDLQPYMLGQQSGSTPRSTDQPMPTVASDGAISLIQPQIVRYNGQSDTEDIDNPLSTILTNNKHGLVKPTLIEFYGDIRNQEVDTPLTTITQRIKHGLINPTLVEVNHSESNKEANGRRTPSINDPLPSPTTKRAVALANPSIIEINHGNGNDGDKGNDRRVHSVDEPIVSITTSPGLGLVSPMLVQTGQTGGNGGYSRPTNQPLPTLTTRNDMNVVTPVADPYIIPNFGERDGQEPRTHDIDEPVPTVTSRGAGSLVTPILEQLEEANIDPRRLIVIDGHPYLLDIRFRMLQNQELARAMGFQDEETTYEFHGTVAEITKQIGNAVPVNLAAALVKAILSPTQEQPDNNE